MCKACSKCKDLKLVSMFNKDRQKSDGLASVCKECARLVCAGYYMRVSNPSKRNKKRDGLSQTNANEYIKIYRQENPEKIKQYRDSWAVANKPSIKHKNMRHYVSKKQRVPHWLTKAHKAEIEGMYLFCEIFKGFEVDHIVPLRGKQVSGLHVPWNLQVLPAELNRVKSNKFTTNWS